MLTVSVKNFGPLVEGTVDLNPLTVFLGPSNTGKSYMATAVYALMRAAARVNHVELPYDLHGGIVRSRFLSRAHFEETEESNEMLKELREWVNRQIREGKNISELTTSSLPENVQTWLEKTTLQRIIFFQDDIPSQLRQIHGEEYGFVSRNSEPKFFQLNIQKDDPILNVEVQLMDEEKPLPKFDISQATVPETIFDLMPHFTRLDEEDWVSSEIASSLVNAALESTLAGLPIQTYYLPAARSGIAQGHKVLAAALVRQSSLIGIRRLNIPTLPGITTEFLSHLISFDRRMGRRRRISKLDKAIEFIETDVLHGRIILDESTELPYPEIAYVPVGTEPLPGKFTLEHTSSMVSELAPLILFLKYLVAPGNLLILEEPESHLHPAAQLQMARGIARLVNAGVRVLVTTHSGDFMGQIDNLISMSNVSRETAESLGLEPEECLYPEQVSAYGFRFDAGRGGSVVDPLPVGSDVGIEDQEFLPISELLYEQAITLQRNRLE